MKGCGPLVIRHCVHRPVVAGVGCMKRVSDLGAYKGGMRWGPGGGVLLTQGLAINYREGGYKIGKFEHQSG